MAFFAEDDNKDEPTGDVKLPERLDLEWVLIARRMGFTLAELNEFRIRDLIPLVDLFIGENKGGKKMATQQDINRFFR